MQGLRSLSVRTKLVGGFVVVLLLMGTTLAVDIVTSGNQVAIANRIVNHLDPARIAAAKIVTLVRSIDDDGAWAVNSMSGNKAHSDQLLQTYYGEVADLKTTVATALDLADTDAQRAAIGKFQAFYWGTKPLTDPDRKTLDSQSKDVFTGSDSYLFGNERIFAEARSGQYAKAAFDYTTVPFVGALDSAQIYIDAVQKQIDQATADGQSAASLAQTLSIGLGLLAVLLALAVALSVTRSIVNGVKAVQAAEGALRKSEARYRALYADIPSMYFTVDPAGTVLSANAFGASQLGYSVDELVGGSVLQVFPEDQRVEATAHVAECLAHPGEVFIWELRKVRKDGSALYAKETARAVPGGDDLTVLIVSEDITEQRQAEARDRAQNTVATVLATAVTLTDATSRLLEALCVTLDWDLGQLWVNDRESGELCFEQAWQCPGLDLGPFIEASRGHTFAVEVGLPGTVARSREVAWIPDVAADPGFRRVGVAVSCRLRAGIAFPVLADFEMQGVIELFARGARPLDPDLARLLAAIGNQFGQFIERKEAEADRQAAHQRVLDVIDFVPDATFVIDTRKRVIAWNRAIEEMTGVQREDIVGQGDYAYAIPWYGERRPILIDLLDAPDDEATFEHYDNVHRQGSAVVAETFIPGFRGGEGIYISDIAAPLIDPLGRRVGAIECIRDVSESKRAEAVVAASEERYRRITETITDYMFTVKVEGDRAVRTVHGPGCVAVTGYTPEELGEDPGPWLVMVVPEDRSAVIEQARAVLAGERFTPIEHRIVRKDGALRWVRSTPVPQYGPDGSLVAYDGLIQDITERRKLR